MSQIKELQHVTNNNFIIIDNLVAVMQAAYLDYRINGASSAMAWVENYLSVSGEIPNTTLSAEEWHKEHTKELSFFDEKKEINLNTKPLNWNEVDGFCSAESAIGNFTIIPPRHKRFNPDNELYRIIAPSCICEGDFFKTNALDFETLEEAKVFAEQSLKRVVEGILE